MKKELLFAAIAPHIGINKHTNRILQCDMMGDIYIDEDCNDCLFCVSCCAVPEESLNLMKIFKLKELWDSWDGKKEILDYAKANVGVDIEDDTELFDCSCAGLSQCANCRFAYDTPWCSRHAKIKFFLQFE